MDPISALQVATAGWMGRLVDGFPLGYAFGAGMMSAVNPCGFLLLPTYLALFLGTKHEDYQQQTLPRRLGRALAVSGVMSLGFVLLFGFIGGLVAAGARFVVGMTPWISVALGVGLVLLGAWMLAGRHVASETLLRWGSRIGFGPHTGLRGYFLYGLAFGVCSVGCTLPVFLVVVGSAVASGGTAAAFSQFVSYGLGMGAVVTLTTLAVATLKDGLVLRGARGVMPYLQPATAVFVMLAGLYIIYYWLFKGDLLA